ncbi:hypothetical protein D3C81_1448260 [compost metagenome]
MTFTFKSTSRPIYCIIGYNDILTSARTIDCQAAAIHICWLRHASTYIDEIIVGYSRINDLIKSDTVMTGLSEITVCNTDIGCQRMWIAFCGSSITLDTRTPRAFDTAIGNADIIYCSVMDRIKIDQKLSTINIPFAYRIIY